jgi:hypothetical protein
MDCRCDCHGCRFTNRRVGCRKCWFRHVEPRVPRALPSLARPVTCMNGDRYVHGLTKKLAHFPNGRGWSFPFRESDHLSARSH